MDLKHQYWLTGEISLDVLTRKAHHQNLRINLSDLSFKTMQALIRAFPATISNQELIDDVWQKTAVSPETVTQRIALIRKALSDVGLDPREYLSSTRNVGYRWLKPIVKTEKRVQHRNRKVFYAVSIPLLFMLIGWWLLADVFFDEQPSTELSNVDSTSSAVVSVEDLANQALKYLRMHNAKSNQLAIDLYREALVLDANHINSLIGLSFALSHEVTKFNQSYELLEEAKSLAAKVIELDESNSKAWTALAFADDASGHINQAIEGYQNAIKLAPENASSISSLAYLYSVKGRLVEAFKLNLSVLDSDMHYLDLQIAHVLELLGFEVLAEQWYNKADMLSPDSVFATYQKSKFLLSRNKIDQAVSTINQAYERDIKRPELPSLMALIAWKNGNFEAALSHLEDAISIDAGNMNAQLLMHSLLLKSATGETKENMLHKVKNNWLNDSFTLPDPWIYQAHYYAQIGDAEAALASLKQGVLNGYRNHRWLIWLPAFEPLKTDPQWQQLMADIHADVSEQRQQVLDADWLPTSFLDPQN